MFYSLFLFQGESITDSREANDLRLTMWQPTDFKSKVSH
jgi:hypothetical protein